MDTDEALARHLAKDLEAGFPGLVEAHQDRLYTIALRLLGDRRDAEEVAQDALVRAFRAMQGYDRDRITALHLRPWLASIGWQTALDGESRFGQQGLAGRFAWARAPLEIGVAASVGVPVEIADRYARLAVWRRTIAATGALRLGRAPLELVLGASAGAAAFGRSTVAHDENVEPQPPSVVWTPLVAPEATLRLLPRWLGGAVALSLALGADFVPGAPAFVYESQPSGTRETTKRLSWIEPRAGLAIELVVD